MDLLDLPAVAAAMGIPISRVHQLLRDGHLVALRSEDGSRAVPADFIADGAVVKGLPAVIRLLRDARFGDDEILDWLFRSDESLPGSPVEQLRANRGTEIKRRAQVAGF
jgi:hypothetical protein